MYVRSSLFSLLLILGTGCATPTLRAPLPPRTAVRSVQFRQAMEAVITPGFVAGNRVQTLNNGNQIFPAMLRAIRTAKQTITFETYVFEQGEVPQAFAMALAERARAGVEVKVILDAHGAKKSRRYHQEMTEAGVQLVKYHPILVLNPLRYNSRTHRKLLVVDGRVGFIGGVGVAQEWAGDARTPEEWRDQHYRVEGPVVAQLQGAFNDNWLEARHEVLQGPGYYPAPRTTGGVTAKVFFSSPQKDRHTVDLMYHLAIASAQRSLLITNAYFLPDDLLVEALCRAAQRGVQVQILMPGEHIDQKAVRRASRKRWQKLLTAGVRLYEYGPTMVHTKLLVADGYFTTVGSANFDPRSLRINDEANLCVLDAGFAQEQTAIFQRDLQQAEPITLDNQGKVKLHEAPVQAAQTPVEGQL